MARNRDWVDYTNLAANVVQTAQLGSVNSKMRQLAELELQKEYREQQKAVVAAVRFNPLKVASLGQPNRESAC